MCLSMPYQVRPAQHVRHVRSLGPAVQVLADYMMSASSSDSVSCRFGVSLSAGGLGSRPTRKGLKQRPTLQRDGPPGVGAPFADV